MKIVTRVVAVVIFLAALVAGGFWFFQNRSSSQAAAQAGGNMSQVVSVQMGSLNASISVVGQLYAPQNETLRFERAAGATDLLSLDVTAGNVVEAGQVLAAIDPSPYEQALEQAQSDLQEAEERLADLLTPATDLQSAQADLAIARAELALQQAQDDLDALQSPDVDDLRAAVAAAQLDLAQAQADLLAVEIDRTYEDQLYRLQEAEADASAQYTRLAGETYSDAYYQDRLRLAHNALLDAQDARSNYETQRQISLLQAQIKVRRAQQGLADAQESLAEAENGGDELDLAQAQQAVAQAQADRAQAQADRAELDAGADAVDLAAAQADVEDGRLAVSEAELDLAGATMTAPFAGSILQTYAKPGDRITASSNVLTIANLNELQVVASIDETTIRQVAAGQNAQITFDAFPGQTFSGQVLSVPLQGALQGGVMVYDVPISLVGAEDLPLLVGMTANVSIQVGQVEDALLAPTMAVQNVGGFYQVLVPSSDPEGEPQAVPVEVGLSNGVYTQIVRGLNAGDQVLVQFSAADSGAFDFRAMRQIIGGGGGGQRPPGFRN